MCTQMAQRCKGIFIVGAKRTPFCQYGGPLRDMQASHAFAAAAIEAIRSADVDPLLIDSTVVGNVNYLSQCDGGKTPRYCGIYSGVPLDRPALGVNKACGSGLQAIINGAVEILTGASKICLTGGTEIMSSMPLFVRNVRFGTTLGSAYLLEDTLKKQIVDNRDGTTLQKVAEDLAKKYGIKREEVDEYALRSNLKWKAADEANVFDNELISLNVKQKKKEIAVDKDQVSPLTVEELANASALLEDGHYVTASNYSGPADGAAALLLVGEEALKRHNLTPLARIAAWACVGVGINELGAVPAVNTLLKGNDVDLFEINETFASEALITVRELKIDPAKVNLNGGALAIGNPTAATGARIATHLVHELGRRNMKRGIAASNCGGGQGVAIVLEKV